MKSPTSEIESDVKPGRKGLWGLLQVLASLLISLATFFKLTDAEQQEAGIYIEHQGEE